MKAFIQEHSLLQDCTFGPFTDVTYVVKIVVCHAFLPSRS